ncbi:MAG: PadR family transcriptional regulator [Candidatus Micrarchaeales archaeon]
MEGKTAFASKFMPMEVKRVILKIRILGRVKAGKIYSYALIKEFEKSGFSEFFGPTLKNDTYNALKVLEKSNYIKMQAKIEGGKVKNYYTITKSGSETLKSVGKMMIGTMKEADKLFK